MLALAQNETEYTFDMDEIAEPSSFTLLGTRRMTYEDWSKIRSCPFQRDTENHAREANHLKVFSELHRKVTIAVLPNGDRYKVDGHTRGYCWSNGMTAGLPSPLVLSVDVFKCEDASINSLGALYNQIDNKKTMMSAYDIAHSAANELELNFASAMFRADRHSPAAKHLYSMMFEVKKTSEPEFTYKAIKFFKEELLLLDKTNPKSTDYLTPILMAALLTFAKYGEGAIDFWTKFGNNEGDKAGNEVDGVQATRNLLPLIKDGRSTAKHYKEFIGRALNAFHRYRKGETYRSKNGIPEIKRDSELKKYFQDTKAVKAFRKLDQ